MGYKTLMPTSCPRGRQSVDGRVHLDDHRGRPSVDQTIKLHPPGAACDELWPALTIDHLRGPARSRDTAHTTFAMLCT